MMTITNEKKVWNINKKIVHALANRNQIHLITLLSRRGRNSTEKEIILLHLKDKD